MTAWFTYLANIDGERVTKRTVRSPESLKGKPVMVVLPDANGNFRACGIWGSLEIPPPYLHSKLGYRFPKANLIAGPNPHAKPTGGSDART